MPHLGAFALVLAIMLSVVASTYLWSGDAARRKRALRLLLLMRRTDLPGVAHLPGHETAGGLGDCEPVNSPAGPTHNVHYDRSTTGDDG